MNPGMPPSPAADDVPPPSTKLGKWGGRVRVGLVLIAIGALALGFRSLLYHRALSLAPKPSEAPPMTVRVQPLVSETVSSALTYSGPVKELEKAELSFRVGGTITGLHRVKGPDGMEHAIHEGDIVTPETVLASLDTADFVRDRDVAAEKLATAGAYLAQQESEASLALLEFRRVEQLWKSNATSISNLDTAKTKQVSTALAVAGARRDRESARIALAQAEANISYCTLKSPFRQGTVAARFVDVGQRVTANQKSFLLLDLSSVVIGFGVPDTLVGSLVLGQKVDVLCDALPGRRFQAVVHKIASAADQQTRTYPIEVRVDNQPGLKPGMIATVEFRKEVKAYLLPLTAVVPDSRDANYRVFRVVERDGKSVAEAVPVRFDNVLDNRVELRLDPRSLLKPGDRVVSTGTHRLHDGQPVQVEP